MGQQERQDEQFRNLINMMIALSKYKTEQGQYSQEWQNKLSEQAAARSIEERRTKAYEEGVKGREENIPDWLQKAMIISQQTGKPLGQVVSEMQPPPQKTIEQIKAEAKARAEGQREGAPPKPTSPKNVTAILPPQIRGTTQLTAGTTTPLVPPVVPPPSQRIRKNELSAVISDDGKNIVLNGKKYKINPDGTVTIDGKPYQIR
jgi:hypothetical protein